MASTKKMTLRDVDNTFDQVNYYASSHSLTQQDAAIRLLRIGLMAENDGIYTTELSHALVAAVRTELASVTSALRFELSELTSTVEEKLTSAEAASYASLFATLKGKMDKPDNLAADIFSIAGNIYASGAADMESALRIATDLRGCKENK